MKKILNEKLIIILSIITSLAALYFTYTHNYILTYNDAASHLNIARRVVDNLTPGLAQIGTVWLPLPHILMIPFAWNDYLWHTGFAGSIVSMAAYVISILLIYKIILLITENSIGSTIGALIMAINPNFLYLQTTPMTEPLLLATMLLAIYFVARYIKTHAINDLVLAGGSVALSTLVRYDGWFLFLSLSFLLPIWVYKLFGKKEAESSFFLFIFSGGFGIFLWVLWNLTIFGDPLYFITGPYSAYAQQRVLKEVGQLPTEGNLINSLTYYFWAMIENNGLFLMLSMFIGVILAPILLKNKRYILILLAALSPIVFNIIALYVGQSAMNVPQAPHDPGLFNIRYGLMALPAIAILLGVISANKYLRYIIILIVLIQSGMFFKQGIPVSLADGLYGLKQTYYTVEAGKWLKENYTGGLILTSNASNDAFVARAGIPLKNYVHEGTRNHWKNALTTPSKTITYIATLTFPPDRVYKVIKNNPDFLKNFTLVHTYNTFKIYKKR